MLNAFFSFSFLCVREGEQMKFLLLKEVSLLGKLKPGIEF